MIQDQDQDVQIIHSNNNISEEFSKQQLDTITGGCLGCGAVRFEAKVMAKDIAKKIPQTDDTGKRFDLAYVGNNFNLLSKKAKISKSIEAGPCPSFENNRSTLDAIHQLKNLIP